MDGRDDNDGWARGQDVLFVHSVLAKTNLRAGRSVDISQGFVSHHATRLSKGKRARTIIVLGLGTRLAWGRGRGRNDSRWMIVMGVNRRANCLLSHSFFCCF